jgi:hypothetical protein
MMAGGGVEVISNGDSWSHAVSDIALKDTDRLLSACGGVDVIRNGTSWSHPVVDDAVNETDRLLGTGIAGGGVELISNGDSWPYVVSDNALTNTDRLLGASGGVEVISKGHSSSHPVFDSSFKEDVLLATGPAGGGVEVISTDDSWSHTVSDDALKGTEKLLAGSGVELISTDESWSHPVFDNASENSTKLLGEGPLDGGVDIISNSGTRLHALSDLAGGGVEVLCTGDSMPDIDPHNPEKPLRSSSVGSGISEISDIGQTSPNSVSGEILIDDEVVQTCKRDCNTKYVEIIHDIDRLLKTSTEFAMIRSGTSGAGESADVKPMFATENRAEEAVAVVDNKDLFALAVLLQCAAQQTLRAARMCQELPACSERCHKRTHMVHAV